MKRVGSDVTAEDRWRTVGASYAKGMAGPYHEHRIAVIKALLPDLRAKRIVDFGCGEGVMIREARAMGAGDVIGIDLDAPLLDLAKSSGADRLILGSVPELAKLDRADCLLSANVLAYFTDAENETFYKEARRLLPPGGALVLTHSNELFDLFTLNAFTAAFHERHFANNVRPLLVKPDVPTRLTFNVRENPLSYPDRMEALGFRVERMEFINFHPKPPLLTTIDYDDINSREYLDTLAVPKSERWKLMFQCSMFGVRAIRLAT